jgi:hypothetical protein
MQITNRKQFFEVAENWYQRTHKLREVWQDENCTPERKDKAYKLWQIMGNRMMNITQKAIELSQPRLPNSFMPGSKHS